MILLTCSKSLAIDAWAQECQYVVEDGKRVDRALIVDGEYHYIFPEEEGRKMLKDLSSYMLLKAEKVKLEELIQTKDQLIELFRTKISLLNSELDFLRGYAMKHGSAKDREAFYQSSEFKFLTGVLAGVALTYTSSLIIENVNGGD